MVWCGLGASCACSTNGEFLIWVSSSRGSATLSADGSLLGLECLLDGVFGRSSAGSTSSYTGGGGGSSSNWCTSGRGSPRYMRVVPSFASRTSCHWSSYKVTGKGLPLCGGL